MRRVQIERHRTPLVALGVLLLVDSVFVLLHVIHRLGERSGSSEDERYFLETDRGYLEFFGYGKELLLGVVLLLLFWRERVAMYAALSLTFLLILIDDSLLLHETGGMYFARHFDVPSWIGLRALDVGELLVVVPLGALAGAALVVAYRHTPMESRHTANCLLSLLAALAFFAIVVDMVHALFVGSETGLTIVEDGGEQIVLSATVAYVLWIEERTRPPSR
jgi:hypothetical protein